MAKHSPHLLKGECEKAFMDDHRKGQSHAKHCIFPVHLTVDTSTEHVQKICFVLTSIHQKNPIIPFLWVTFIAHINQI